MFKRWLIRSVFMLPLLLCVAGWGWSVRHLAHVWLDYHEAATFLSTRWGKVQLAWNPKYGDLEPPVGFDSWPVEAHLLEPDNGRHYTVDFSFPGFRYTSEDGTAVDVSYWLLILLFSVALVFVWRKTCKPIELRAFPVEVGGKHA
jgi:hypothetical protein